LIRDLYRDSFSFKESQCTIISDKQNGINAAIDSIKRNYLELASFIQANPLFLNSFTPVTPVDKPLIACLMSQAAQKADVGPMAAVAGALADLAVKDMLKSGCEVAVVEDIAVAAGNDPLSKRFGFRLSEFPVGIATSSGCFSHAVSFGDAEAATIFCNNAALADAAATAVCNVVKGEALVGINAGISRGLSIEGVEGIIILYKGQVGTAGKIPQMIKVNDET
jgi:ApbE superfamily uncharacterized protein (UPF0280 family)